MGVKSKGFDVTQNMAFEGFWNDWRYGSKCPRHWLRTSITAFTHEEVGVVVNQNGILGQYQS